MVSARAPRENPLPSSAGAAGAAAGTRAWTPRATPRKAQGRNRVHAGGGREPPRRSAIPDVVRCSRGMKE